MKIIGNQDLNFHSNDMIPKKLFYFWEGKKYPYIEYCLKSIEKRSGVRTYLITPANIEYYMSGIEVNANWRKIKVISQKTDILRIAVLYKHGGLYLDADTVILKNLNTFFDKLPVGDTIVTRWKINNKILNGYFFAQKNARFLHKCLKWINGKLKEGKRYYEKDQGVYFGEVMFKEIASKYPQYINYFDPEVFLPIQFPFQRDIWHKNVPIEYYLKPHTIGIGLNHSQYSDTLKNTEIGRIKKSGNLFGNIFKYSDSLGKI